MNTNDLIRLPLLVAEHEEIGTRLLLVRINAALLWEIATFVETSQRSPEVSTFISELPDPTKSRLDTAMSGIRGPGQTPFGKELAHIRNQVFHYPGIRQTHTRREPLRRALASAAEQQGTMGGNPVRNFRFGFADEVALRLFSRSADASVVELEELATELTHRNGAFREFADGAMFMYLNQTDRRTELRLA